MALLSRLFSSRRKPFARTQDNASEKLFTFTNDQVRVIVFRECDFRGRKLLFDSKTVRKEPLTETQEAEPERDPHSAKKYVEITNGHAYRYTKPCSDVSRLGEMIFGSVAMSFRGTTYKIHSVPVPSQLVCSQVFPSPKNPVKMRRSAPSNVHTGSSIEHSIRLEDSGASSATSGSDQSVLSGASDTVLVCKRQHSIPLDVPANFSLVSSSGYGEEHSYSSVSSGPQSIPVDLSQGVHSGDSLSKRWPCWSLSGSMDPSTSSLPGSASTEESFHKVRSSKIGLAVLIELTDGEEEKLEQFLMEHAALVEMMMWRVRRGVEGAYIRHNTFVSTMVTVSSQSARWLVDLLTGARNFVQTWHSHFPNCDNLFSIINKSPSISFLGHLTGGSPQRTFLHTDSRDAIRFSTLTSGAGLFSSFKSESSGCIFDSSGEFNFANLSRLLKHESMGGKKDEGVLLAEKFLKEFCELLEGVDVKHTNFFISTLVTAVLTHHLGWVNTVLPVALKQNQPHSTNPFWSQLTELYGAIGYPLKMSRTVVSGSQKTELVPKIINALKYFIRCTEVSRHYQTRVGVDFENANADSICAASSCLPKENYKKYEDHLREIEEFTKAENQQQILKLKMPYKSENKEDTVLKMNIPNNNGENFIQPPKKLSLVKTHTCLNELDKLCENQEKHTDILDKVTNLGLQAINSGDEIDVACSFLHNINTEVQQLVDINEAKQQIERVFSPKKKISESDILIQQKPLLKLPVESEKPENNTVVFVLGDNEKLVGIKREVTPTKLSFKDDANTTMLNDKSSPFETSPEITPTLKRRDFLSQYLDHNSNQHSPKPADENVLKDLHEPSSSAASTVKMGLKKSKTFSKEMNASMVIEKIPVKSSSIVNSSSNLTKPDITHTDDSNIPTFTENSSGFGHKNKEHLELTALTIPQAHPVTIGLKKSKTVCKELNINKGTFEFTENKNDSETKFESTDTESKTRKIYQERSIALGLRKSKTVCQELSTEIELKNLAPEDADIFSKIGNNKNYSEKELIKIPSDIKFTTITADDIIDTFENKENVINESTKMFTSDLIMGSVFNENTELRKSNTVAKELNLFIPIKVKSLTDLSTNIPFTHCPTGEIPFPKHDIPTRGQIEDLSFCLVSGKELEKSKLCIPITSKSSPPESTFENATSDIRIDNKIDKPIDAQRSEQINDSGLMARQIGGSIKRKSSWKLKKSKNAVSGGSSNFKECKKSNFESTLNMQTFESSNMNTSAFESASLNDPLNAFKLKRVASFSKSLEFAGVRELASSFQTCAEDENAVDISNFKVIKQAHSFETYDKNMDTSIFEDVVCVNKSFYEADTSPFKESDFAQCLGASCIKPSSSYSQIQLKSSKSKPKRAASEPPNTKKLSPSTSTKYKYSGVKFNFQQYPQIVENYMKNKSIELSNMQFSEKKLDFRWQSSSTFDYSKCEGGDDFDEGEALTTPSNASELEFTSELVVDKIEGKRAQEVLVDQPGKRLEFTRNVVPNTVIREPNPYEHAKLLKDVKNRKISEERTFSNLKVVELPMPKSMDIESHFPSIDYTNSLIRGLDDHYVSDMVLQGTTAPKIEWEQLLKKDLLLSTQHTFSNQQVEESIAIVANTDTWEVQLMSSHTYVIDRSSAGVPVGMSQLVANMLETLLHMWRLHTPAEYCLMHIEQQLQEFCLRSKALAQFLLDTDFCSMEILTSTLRLEVNDVPLLMAIASTHTPQVTQKYGLSFQ